MLERQLAAAGEPRDSLTKAGEEAQAQLADTESRRGEQARRIQELELQLAAAEIAASQSAGGWKNAATEPGHRAAEQGETASPMARAITRRRIPSVESTPSNNISR